MIALRPAPRPAAGVLGPDADLDGASAVHSNGRAAGGAYIDTMGSDVLVLGGGAAGLSAARVLVDAGRSVIALEAREQPGGRVRTLQVPGLGAIELGAEFLHGEAPISQALARSVRARPRRVKGRVYRGERGGPKPAGPEFAAFGALLAQLDAADPDVPVAAAIATTSGSADDRAFALSFLQGFHALDPTRASMRAILLEEGGDPGSDALDSWRLDGGQAALLGPLLSGVDLRTRHEVTCVSHGTAGVEVVARTPFGDRTYQAKKLVIALPLGVLQAGTIRFDPPLPWTLDAVASGGAQRVVFGFRSRFWDEIAPSMGFLHGQGQFRTFWADGTRPVLTAWCGGPPAWRLSDVPEAARVSGALDDLATALSVPRSLVEDSLQSWHTHDWQSDPYARGAYSYVSVGGVDRLPDLAEPRGLLALAGEYVPSDAVSATLEAALASGRRAGEWAR